MLHARTRVEHDDISAIFQEVETACLRSRKVGRGPLFFFSSRMENFRFFGGEERSMDSDH